MKLLRLALLSLFTLFAAQAHAQRTPVPVVDFVNVPVPAAAKAAAPEQVRAAFQKAAVVLGWEITPVSEGVLEGRFVKDHKHTVVTTIQYSAQGYSVLYKSSDNMKFDAGANAADPNNFRVAPMSVRAYDAQKKLFLNDPFTPYAVARKEGELHPFYEVWVRRLMTGVNGELKAS